jgi:hypothetical protein
MVTVVALDVPADLAPSVADAVADSCRNAIGMGRCTLSRKLAASTSVAWYAVIRIDDAEPAKLRIVFRSRTATGAMVAQRILSFSDRDVPETRWASAGLVVAGLVAAQDASASSPTPVEREKSEPPQEPRAPRPPDLAWGADAGGLFGQGLQRGAFRIGAFGRGWVGATSSGLVGAVSVRFAEREGTTSLTWWSASAGLGARFGKSRNLLNAELIGELVLERLLVSAVDSSRGLEDNDAKNRFGGRLGANVTIRLAGGLRFLVGADASAMTPPVDIQVKGNLEGREPSLRFAFTTGFRLDL